VSPEVRKMITLDSNILDKYVGKYKVQNIIFAIIRKGDNLFLKTPFGTELYQLYAESETVFLLKTNTPRMM